MQIESLLQNIVEQVKQVEGVKAIANLEELSKEIDELLAKI